MYGNGTGRRRETGRGGSGSWQQRWEHLLFAHWPVDPERAGAAPAAAGRAGRPRRGGLARDRRRSGWSARRSRLGAERDRPADPRAERPDVRARRRHSGRLVPQPRRIEPVLRRHGACALRPSYHLARMVAAVDGDRVHYLSSRRSGAAFSATYRPCGPARPLPRVARALPRRALPAFSEWHGRLITAEVAHEPWPLQPAEAQLELNRMAPPASPSAGSLSFTTRARWMR